MSRLLFELRVLGRFLWEVISFPGGSSTIHVDHEKRTIEVMRVPPAP